LLEGPATARLRARLTDVVDRLTEDALKRRETAVGATAGRAAVAAEASRDALDDLIARASRRTE